MGKLKQLLINLDIHFPREGDWTSESVYATLHDHLKDRNMTKLPEPLGVKKPQHPTTSTTHLERYYHVHPHTLRCVFHWVGDRAYNGGTVFFRKEGEHWWASVSRCSENDQFCRRTGRTVARRRYFNDVSSRAHVSMGPSYETARDFFYNENL